MKQIYLLTLTSRFIDQQFIRVYKLLKYIKTALFPYLCDVPNNNSA